MQHEFHLEFILLHLELNMLHANTHFHYLIEVSLKKKIKNKDLPFNMDRLIYLLQIIISLRMFNFIKIISLETITCTSFLIFTDIIYININKVDICT